MVSEFQLKLGDIVPPLGHPKEMASSFAEADFCHEMKEVIDAVVKLEDDLQQAKLANTAGLDSGRAIPQADGGNISPGSLQEDLTAIREKAKKLLEAGGCPGIPT